MLAPLLTKISKEFPNQSTTCLKNVLLLSLCILIKETLNLNKLKGLVKGILDKENIKDNSSYKRLIRIFDNYAFSRLWLDLLSFVFRLLDLKGNYLLLDGTSWKSGQKSYHYMTLCLIHEGVAIPIYWINLHKLGISNVKERIKLIKKAKRQFNLSDKTLIADREYIGTKWFKFLIDNGLNFAIRLRKNLYKKAINQSKGKSYQTLQTKVLRSKVAKKVMKKAFVLEGMQLFFIVFKNPKNDPKEPLIFLITNLDKPAKQIVKMYALRWKIESCFKHLKSNGFQLEQINLQTESRTRLLMAITVFAYAISILEGLKTYKTVPIKTYQDGSQEKAESVFRHGINAMMIFCLDLAKFCTYFLEQLKKRKRKKNALIIINV